MKKIAIAASLLFLISVEPLNACTTFFLEKNGQMVFGKNYDWMTGTGMINTNLRGLAKSSLPVDGGNVTKWTSKYGSTTFNQYGKEFPNGGMNEKGLVVELMWLSESKFPAKDKRAGLTVLQWIQYQLDNSSNVDDVIASDKVVRIVSLAAPQHYLVADAKGNVATIEFLQGKMVVHRGAGLPFPVLANNSYESSLTALRNKATKGNNSLERFGNACTMVQQYRQTNINKPLVDYSFDILNKVAQAGYTQWSIVYDIGNRKIYFKTADQQQQRSFSATGFDYGCSAVPVAYLLNGNETGDIGRKFSPYSDERNRNSLIKAFKESAERINVKQELQKIIADFATLIRCLKS